MAYIGVKLANGEFYPIFEESTPTKKKLVVTTVNDNQPNVQIDLYRGEPGFLVDDSSYIGSLLVNDIARAPKGVPDIELDVLLKDDMTLEAFAQDKVSGGQSKFSVALTELPVSDIHAMPQFDLQETESLIDETLHEADLQGIENTFDNLEIEEPVSIKREELESLGVELSEPDENALDGLDFEIQEEENQDQIDQENAKSLADFEESETLSLDELSKIEDLGTFTEAEQNPEQVEEFSLEEQEELADDALSNKIEELSATDESITREGADSLESLDSAFKLGEELSLDIPENEEPSEDVLSFEPSVLEESEETSILGPDTMSFDVELPEPDEEIVLSDELETPPDVQGLSEIETEAENEIENTTEFENMEPGIELSGESEKLEEDILEENAENAMLENGLLQESTVPGAQKTAEDFSIPEVSETIEDFSSSELAIEGETLGLEEETVFSIENSDTQKASRKAPRKESKEDRAVKQKNNDAYKRPCAPLWCKILVPLAIILLAAVILLLIGRCSAAQRDAAATKNPVPQQHSVPTVEQTAPQSSQSKQGTQGSAGGAGTHATTESTATGTTAQGALSTQGTGSSGAASEVASGATGTTVQQGTQPSGSGSSSVQTQPAAVQPKPVSTKPAKPAPGSKTPGVWYKIRWGDTLWDLSIAFYRTPWKYMKIYNANRKLIKHPDKIIAGTWIYVPK